MPGRPPAGVLTETPMNGVLTSHVALLAHRVSRAIANNPPLPDDVEARVILALALDTLPPAYPPSPEEVFAARVVRAVLCARRPSLMRTTRFYERDTV